MNVTKEISNEAFSETLTCEIFLNSVVKYQQDTLIVLSRISDFRHLLFCTVKTLINSFVFSISWLSLPSNSYVISWFSSLVDL